MDTSILKDKVEYGVDWLNAVLMNQTDVKFFFDMLSARVDHKLGFEHFQKLDHGTYNYKESYGINGQRIFIVAYNRSPKTIPVDDPISTSDIYHNEKVKKMNNPELTACDSDESGNPYIFISVSGDGLRYINSLNMKALENFFFVLKTMQARCSRIDVNMDLFVENPIVSLLQDSCRFAMAPVPYKPTLRTKLMRKGKNFSLNVNFDDLTGEEYMNVTIGNHSSQWGMFRCYNKSAELRNAHGLDKESIQTIFDTKGLDLKDYWWRLEYELHKDRADQIFKACLDTLETGDNTFQVVFLAALDKMFTPVIASDNVFRMVNHLNELEVVSDWADFMEFVGNSIHFVQLTNIPYIPRNNLPKFQKNLKRLSGYIFVILRYLDYDPEFVSELIKSGAEKYYKQKDSRYLFLNDIFDSGKTVDGKHFVNPLFSSVVEQVNSNYSSYDEVF